MAPTPAAWTGVLDEVEVRTALDRARVLSALHPVAEVGSTQDLAASLASQGAPGGLVVVADRQTSGRGRSGRGWDDRPDGGTLAVTLLLDVGTQVPSTGRSVGLVPHALGLAVLRTCVRLAPELAGLGLKWPNDVVHREDPAAPPRKVAGVLVEREQVGAPRRPRDVLLCGIGLNVDLGHPGEHDRVCLGALAGRAPDRTVLLATLLGELDQVLVELAADLDTLVADYRRASDTIGRRVRFEAAGAVRHEGVVQGVDDTGRLLVATGAETHAILSGTIRDAIDGTEPTS